MLVDKNELKRANYKMEISNSIIDTTAPSIAGIIFSVLSAPFIFIIDGVSFILASICQYFISSEVEKNIKKSNKKVVVHIKDAYKYIYKDRLLFVLAISYFMLVFGIGIFQSIQFYYLSKVLEISTTIIGIIISIGNIGLVISSIISFKISEYFGGGKTIIISFFLYALGFLLYYLSDSASVILIVIANILIGAAMPLYNVNASTIRQGKVDISMLGSVSAIWRIFGRGMIPLGATIGGFISTVFSVKFSILISFIVVFISMLVCIFSKELRKYKE
jgi:transporter, major facilitator family